MSRVRFMSPYLKGGRDTAKLSNRARYIATRPGVEVIRGEHSDQPATKKQHDYIQRLLRDFPGAEELLEYEDYCNAPTQANANTFIRQVQEDFAEPMSRMENYLDYVSHRPGVQLNGEHGLWCAGGKVRNLSQAVREVASYSACLSASAWAACSAAAVRSSRVRWASCKAVYMPLNWAATSALCPCNWSIWLWVSLCWFCSSSSSCWASL